MKKRMIYIFFVEVLLLFIALIFSHWVLGFDKARFVQLFTVFLFLWIYAYSGRSISFEYFTHVLRIILMYVVIGIILALALESAIVLCDVLISISIWFVLTVVFRVIYQKMIMRPLVGLVDLTLAPRLPKSEKVEFYGVDKIDGKMLGKFDFILVDNTFEYGAEWKSFLLHAQVLNIPIVTLSEYEEMVFGRLSLKDLQQSWLSSGFKTAAWYVWVKLFWEYVFILLISPFVLTVSLIVSGVILVKMGRPIFFRQWRLGKDGRLFQIYKFRSMHKHNGLLGETTQDDVRITKFGNFIRKYRLDELPQLINILKGEMSLIGPRPEWEKTATEFSNKIPLYKLRHSVRPGITGWAQVNQGHVTGIRANDVKLQYDLYYVKRFSMTLDLIIFCKTMWTILTGFGAK
ncbi:sugar transferase [Francisellaceae bacterium]|nr:sugar transferase [Francisellaceae bacterium]